MNKDGYEQHKNGLRRVFYKVASDKDELGRLFDYDERRFRQSYVADINTANQRQLAAKLVFFSHSLEKSLSNDNFEIGHGFRVATWLVDMLRIYNDKNYDPNHTAYISTLSVLQAFYNRHKGTKFEAEIEDIFGERSAEIKSCKSDIGGSDEILLKDKLNNDKKNFKELAEGRFTVRSYSEKPVDKKDIVEAVGIAMKTPTVCNRQSLHVHAIYKKEVIERVLEVQGGLAYYDTPPVLLLITADDNGYVGANERNQGFVDGGLFAMSVLYALEYKKLAACPAHAMLTETEEMTVRGMLDLPDSEKLITFITVGHFKERNKVCRSFRYPVDYILSDNDKIHDFVIETIADRPVENGSAEDSSTSTMLKIRRKLRARTRLINFKRKLRPRTRVKNLLLDIKHATRVRTRVRTAAAHLAEMRELREYENTDGAILTLTGYFNYGNILQRYALQKFLKKHGYNFVSYVDSLSVERGHYPEIKMNTSETLKSTVTRFLHGQKPYRYIPRYGEVDPKALNMENIIRFVHTYIWTKPFNPDDTYKSYIVGSDQVWRNWWNNREALGYYFLNFLKNKRTNRIAYAASFGKDKINEVMSYEDAEYVRPYIKLFDRVLVREKSAARMIEKTWGVKDTKVVVDPTLLLSKADYSRLIGRSNMKHEKIQPIFTYVLGETDAILEFIGRVSEDRNQEITRIRSHQGAEDDVLPPVELWLKGFRDAELVITNSYHGMMFSVLNNTDFIIIGKEEGGLSRIKDFLSECEIDGRFVNEAELANFDLSKLKPMDWERVNERLHMMVKESGDQLLSAVGRKSYEESGSGILNAMERKSYKES